MKGNYKEVSEKELRNLYHRYPKEKKIVLETQLIYRFCMVLQSLDYRETKKIRDFNKLITTIRGLDHGIGHWVSISLQKNERLTPSKS